MIKRITFSYIFLSLISYSIQSVVLPTNEQQNDFKKIEKREVMVTPGKEFSITLKESNAGTGYRWHLLMDDPSQKESPITFIRKDFLTKSRPSRIAGGPGPEVAWIFKVSKNTTWLPRLVFVNLSPSSEIAETVVISPNFSNPQ